MKYQHPQAQANQSDQRKQRLNDQKKCRHCQSHQHAAGEIHNGHHGILLQLRDGGSEDRLNATQLLLRKVAHGSSSHPISDGQPVIPEHIKSPGTHGNIHQPLKEDSQQYTDNHNSKGRPDCIHSKMVQIFRNYIDSYQNQRHGNSLHQIKEDSQFNFPAVRSGNL